jgi:hypothetical protein
LSKTDVDVVGDMVAKRMVHKIVWCLKVGHAHKPFGWHWQACSFFYRWNPKSKNDWKQNKRAIQQMWGVHENRKI